MNGEERKNTVNGALARLEAEVSWIKGVLGDLKRAFDRHCSEHRMGWQWAIPTLLILAQFLYTIFRGR